MATCFGDSSGQVYTSIPMSKSSSSSSSTSKTTIPTSLAEALPMSKSSSSTSNTAILTSRTETSPMEGLEAETSLMEELEAEISPIEGLEDVNIRPFVGIPNMRKMIKSEYDRLQKGDTDQQYLVFKPVTVDDLTKIDRARGSIGHIRLAHYTDIGLLIVKIPTAEHESAHRSLGNRLICKAVRMGLPDGELHNVGATRFYGHKSSKEGDSAYRPYSLRLNKTDWPTIVIESAVSESLRHLRFDANWWLTKSGGDVKIIIIILVNRAQLTLQIEKWELGPRTGKLLLTLRSTQRIPTKMQEITIDSNAVTGAPLILEFDKIFLRPAVPPESDFIFTAQDFSTWAARIW